MLNLNATISRNLLSADTNQNAGCEELRAEVARITYRNDDTGWSVLRIRVCKDNAEATAVGNFPLVQTGQFLELFGSWTKHPQYGKQFRVERFVPIRPSQSEDILRYLSSGILKGVGEKTAQKIVQHFGDRTFEILDHNPEKLRNVPSIGKRKSAQILAAWREQKDQSDLLMFLTMHGISHLFTQRIIALYGNQAISIVSKDPYRLAQDIRGIGFIVADGIAQKMGIAADSIERVQAGVLYQLQQAEDGGHCFQTMNDLLDRLQFLLKIPVETLRPRLWDALRRLEESSCIVSQRYDVPGEQDPTTLYYLSELFHAEIDVARLVAARINRKIAVDYTRVDSWLEKYAQSLGTAFTDQQLAAVRQAAASSVFILTGGPGVGKTTTANAIIRLFKAMGKSVALCAPTGRAAQRLTEVAATEARTIHRLLEWNPALHSFVYNEHNPLPVQVVVVDETSMVDINLAHALLAALNEKTQIILIGDCDQLPSVGPGNVLRDLLSSRAIPSIRLDQIFRQSAGSQIVQAAHLINRGRNPLEAIAAESGEVNLADGDFHFLQADTPDDVKKTVQEMVAGTLPKQFGFDPIRDIQLLTPMNRGEIGTQILNQELQTILNPASPEKRELRIGSVVFRTGDKVIQSVNNYDLGVFNGDIGFVRDAAVDGRKLIVRFHDRDVTYQDDALLDVKHAFAVTIHKSQGSEFKAVVVPVTTQHYIMLQRNLIYTALTRARKFAVFIGSPKALFIAVSNEKSSSRRTLLTERIAHAAGLE